MLDTAFTAVRALRRFTCNTGVMSFIIRILIGAVSLWFTTLIVGGNGDHGVWIDPIADTGQGRLLTLLTVALIFGVINSLLGPIVRFVSIPLYIITLGLFGLIVNGLLLLLTAGITGLMGFGLRIDGFWWGVLAALVMSLISAAITAVVRPKRR